MVEELAWHPARKSLRLVVDDIYTDLIGSSMYPGADRGSITFSEVERVSIEIDTIESRLNVYEISVEEVRGKYMVSIRWWPNGAMQVTCGAIDFPSIDLSRLSTPG